MGARNGKGNSPTTPISGRQEAESTKLKQALERYEREVTPPKKSAADEPCKLRNWEESSLADCELAFIHGKHVAEWRDEEIARKEWGMTTLTNPVPSIRLPSAGQGRERCLMSGEESKLLAAAREYESSRSDAGHIVSIIVFALSAYVPDLLGCVATGDTVEEVEREIREAIILHLEGLREDGLLPPPPASRVEYVEVAA